MEGLPAEVPSDVYGSPVALAKLRYTGDPARISSHLDPVACLPDPQNGTHKFEKQFKLKPLTPYALNPKPKPYLLGASRE